ncbi:hypothetical protein ES703_31268 [subsurface metagenome]
MASNDQGSCFCVIGIIIVVFTFVFGLGFFFLIIGGGFFIAGICLSQQKKKAALTSQTPSQPAVQQTAPSTPAPAPPPPQPVKEPEKAKFCPHCGSPATENFCETCGAKID